jgi:FkbM family methyltransferase
MMGMGLAFRSAALRYPGIGASVLRAYLHCVARVPARAAWIVEGLKRDLPCRWEQKVVRLSGGGRLHINSASAVGREIFYSGSYEPALLGVLRRWLTPGMTFIDAGANIGEFTIRAARLVGPSGQIHAIEASPDTFRDLVRNINLNHASNVRAHQIALAERPGTLDFFLSKGVASGSSSLRPAHDFSGRTASVVATTLDEFVASQRVAKVDFIKMDIEGAELDAFRGATGLLGGTHPPVMAFEHHPSAAARFSVSRADVEAFLKRFGYAMQTIGSSAGSSGNDAPENILAIPKHRR